MNGRKRKLSESQLEEFEETVHELPDQVGIDAPALAQEYSRRNLRRQVFNPELSAVAERSGIELSETALFSRRSVPRRTQKKAAGNGRHRSLYRSYKEFKDNLILVLDGPPYFPASAVTDLAARDNLAFVALPSYSPDLTPVEECWRQLQVPLSNHFFASLDELTTAIDTGLEQLSIPKVSNYF